jgi:hypothetical protein
MDKEQVIQRMADAGLKPPARGDFIFIHWDQIALLLAHERKAIAAMVKPLDESLADEILARGNNA